MNLAAMLYGDPAEFADYLDTTEEEVSTDELKALLANLCRRVAALGRQHEDRDAARAQTIGG